MLDLASLSFLHPSHLLTRNFIYSSPQPIRLQQKEMLISAALLVAFWSVAVLGERNLPATVQADLLFPRNNETYKPVPWFPLVFAVKGLPDVWPLLFSLDMTVISASSKLGAGDASYRDLGLIYSQFLDAANESLSNEHLLYIPLVNITNGTIDTFRVRLGLNVLRRCAINGTEIERDWSNRPSELYLYSLDFSTSPDGKVPDIEESIKACPKPQLGSSVALCVSDIFTKPIHAKGVDYQDECAAFEVTESDVCPYKDIAAQVAKNVSDAVLKERRCSKGTWQNITQDCNEKSTAHLLGVQSSLYVLWSVGLILAIAIL